MSFLKIPSISLEILLKLVKWYSRESLINDSIKQISNQIISEGNCKRGLNLGSKDLTHSFYMKCRLTSSVIQLNFFLIHITTPVKLGPYVTKRNSPMIYRLNIFLESFAIVVRNSWQKQTCLAHRYISVYTTCVVKT